MNGRAGARRTALAPLLGGAALLVLWSFVLAHRPLFNPDEGRYAEIPREMLASGDWIVPHLNGLAYIEKPPLQFWVTAAAYRLFGQNEFAARLYSSLCALATAAAVWWCARRLWTRELAWRAAALIMSMLLFALLGQLLTLDMSLTFYMTLALAGFLAAQTHAQDHRQAASRNCMLLAWAATALGVLTKGLIAALIPGAALVIYSLYTRQTAPWRRLQIRYGLPLMILIAAPWHVLAQQRLGDFWQFYFLREHVARFLTPVADREEQWWFFAPVFLCGAFPWTLPALRALLQGWRRRSLPERFDANVFLWIWAVFTLGFFSVSDSKLVPYILPAMPAVAILIASSPLRAQRTDLARSASLAASAALILLVATVMLPAIVQHTDRAAFFLALRGGLYTADAVLALTAGWVWWNRARDLTANTLILGGGSLAAMLLVLRSAAVLGPVYSGVSLAAALPPGSARAPLYSVSTYDQTLPFYARRTVILAAYGGEMDYGSSRAPQEAIGSVEGFLVRWQQDQQSYAVMEPSMFDALRERSVPMREITRDAHRILVARR